jgi:filamentous hemagglutinin family protein
MRVSAASLAVLMAFSPTLSFAQSVPAGVTNIVPDGRTATTVTATGGTSTVTTNTISGQNAFNSFSAFQVGAGNTANLMLPNGTSNLINLVRGGPAVVDGVLNAYKNGQIGGNVYFADPYGFVVGRSGVVNVGSLNVTTPTREFMDGVIGPNGQINQSSVNNLMSGNVPLSPDGFISIKGRVNAHDGARLIGENIYIGGSHSPADVAQLDHASKFAATVNSKGLQSASGIVVRNGSIQIVAGNSARINGRLSANGHKGRNGGDISVTAKSVSVGKHANISSSAKGTVAGNAGNITLLAQDKLTVKSGATFAASSRAGDAGTIELSSKNTVELASAVYDLSAPNGKAGRLYVDPVDLIINAGSSQYTNGGVIDFSADHSITIASDGVLDSRAYDHSAGDVSLTNPLTGNSGDIRLSAPVITVNGKILAGTDNTGFTAGDVTLTSTHSQTLASDKAVSTATIDINGTVTGKDITLNTSAAAVSSYISGLGILATVGQTFQSALSGLNGGYVAGQATSTININNGAHVSGSGKVSLSATGSEEASDPAITLGTGILNPAAATVVVGQIEANVAANINSGASITAGGGLSVIAANDATTAVSAIGITRNGVALNATVAYSQVNVDTNASVSSGATVTVGQNKDVSVIASNHNNFSNSSTAFSLGAAEAGIAFAYSDISTSAAAHLGASLGTSANARVGNVTVQGLSYNQKNTNSASVTVGNPALVTGLLDAVLEAASVTQASIANAIFNTAPAQSGSTAVPKFGSAIAISSSNIASSANIANDGAASGPTIYANNLGVYSDTNVFAQRNLADSSINSETSNPTASNPTALVAISAGVAVGTFAQSSNAYIGPGTTINAYNVGVSASTEVPISNTWTQWAGFGEVLSHLNGNLGVVNNILSSYANATGSSENFSLSGSFDYYALDTKTTAWVGSGSSITTVLNTTPTWVLNLYNGNQATFGEGVDVHAMSDLASVTVAGNITPLLGGTGSDTGAAVGGSLTLMKSSTSTIAGIGDNAVISVAANTAVTVTADTHDTVFTVAPSSGKAATTGLSGIASAVQIDNTTHASISDSAEVTGSSVNISATQELSLMSVSAAVTVSRGSAVGLSVAALVANTDTAAFVGPNHADITGVASQDDLTQVTRSAGYVHSTALNVAATTSGRLYAVSAAAAVQDPTPSTPMSEQLKAMGNILTDGSVAGVMAAAGGRRHRHRSRPDRLD